MKGLKLVDKRLGFPAGICMTMEIVDAKDGFQIAVTDLRANTKTYWEDENKQRVTLATHEEAEKALEHYMEVFVALELSPYPPIPF